MFYVLRLPYYVRIYLNCGRFRTRFTTDTLSLFLMAVQANIHLAFDVCECSVSKEPNEEKKKNPAATQQEKQLERMCDSALRKIDIFI